MSQSLVNSVGLIIIGSFVAAFWAWFWRFRTMTVQRLEEEKRAVVERANKIAEEHKQLEARVAELHNQLGLVSQVVTPINQAMQALLIRELTHVHTPELDALLAHLPPDGVLSPEQEARIAVLLKERSEELNGSIPESERDAATILPYIIKRVRAETISLAETTPQLKIVAVPPETSDQDLASPADAVAGKKQDEH